MLIMTPMVFISHIETKAVILIVKTAILIVLFTLQCGVVWCGAAWCGMIYFSNLI
jgi:hypothetical protein